VGNPARSRVAKLTRESLVVMASDPGDGHTTETLSLGLARRQLPVVPATTGDDLRPGQPLRGSVLIQPLLRDTCEQSSHLRLAVAAMAAKRSDRGELAGLCPPGHGLRIDAE